jgi:serine/threonine-protein kinase
MATIGRYELQGVLGRGGFATVYRAHDPTTGRAVALKVLHPHLADDPAVRERFVREGQALGRVRHPNVVAVYEAGEVGRTVFLATELIEGRTLSAHCAERGPLPFAEALAIADQIAAALEALHAAGLVHRDVKPQNVLLETATGRAVLLDLGLVRALGSASVTRSDVFVGTPGFMAPEQLRAGGQVTPRTDVYQLAATLYTLLTGRPPFEGDPAQVLTAVLSERPPDPRALRPDLPPAVAVVLMQALAKDPDQRPAGARELIARLRAAQAGAPQHRDADATLVAPRATGPATPASAPEGGTLVAPAPFAPALSQGAAASAPPAAAERAPEGTRQAIPTSAAARADAGGTTLQVPRPAPGSGPAAPQPGPIGHTPWPSPPARGPAPAWTPAPPPARRGPFGRISGLAVAAGIIATLIVYGIQHSGSNNGSSTPPPPAPDRRVENLQGGQQGGNPNSERQGQTVQGGQQGGGGGQASGVLVRDDFSDPARGVLPQGSDDPRRYTRTYESGEYVIRKLDPSWNQIVFANVNNIFANTALSVDARLGGNDTRDRGIFIACNSSPLGGYLLRFVPNPTIRYQLQAVTLVRSDGQGSQPSVLAARPLPSEVKRTGSNHIEMVCAGGVIAVRINGKEVVRVQDDTYPGGVWALGADIDPNISGIAEARFDNLVIARVQ